MDQRSNPGPGLMSRDRAHQNEEAPTQRIKQARVNGEQTVGKTIQSGQMWRLESLFHPGQDKAEDDVMRGNTSGHEEENGEVMQVDDGHELSSTSSPSSSDFTPPSSVSSLGTPRPQPDNGQSRRYKRRHEEDAGQEMNGAPHGDSSLQQLSRAVRQQVRHDELEHTGQRVKRDISSATTSSGSTSEDDSDATSSAGTCSSQPLSWVSVSPVSPQLTSPVPLVSRSSAPLPVRTPPRVSSARRRTSKPMTFREVLLAGSRSTTAARALSAPPAAGPAAQPHPTTTSRVAAPPVSQAVSSAASSSASSSAGITASPSSISSSLASITSTAASGTSGRSGRSDDSSPSPPAPPPPSPPQSHPPFWSFPASTPPAHRLDKSSMCQTLSFLDPASIVHIRRTCRLWCEYSYQPIVWSFASSLTISSVERFQRVHFPAVSMLRELELSQCAQLTDEHLACITVCSSLQLLDVSYCVELTDHALTYIAQLRTLQILSLEGCSKLTDLALSHLPSLTLLHSLSLSFCSITDYGVQFISHCSALEFLQLCYCHQLTGRSLQALVLLPNLTNLNLGHSAMKDEDLSPLRQFSGLVSLNLESTEVTEHGLMNLEPLDSLTNVNLHEVHNLSDGALELLARRCPALSSLYLSYSELVTDAGIGHLTAVAHTLRVLEMPECEQITDGACQHISHLTQLTTLDLTGCYHITDQGIQRLASLHHLTLLNLGMLRSLTDDAILAISSLPSLVSLELNSCSQLTPLAAQHVSAIRTLRSLSASEVSHWDDSAVLHLMTLDGLDALCLSGTGITVESLRRLVGLRWIKELNVYGCPHITEEELERVKEDAKGKVAINV